MSFQECYKVQSDLNFVFNEQLKKIFVKVMFLNSKDDLNCGRYTPIYLNILITHVFSVLFVFQTVELLFLVRTLKA